MTLGWKSPVRYMGTVCLWLQHWTEGSAFISFQDQWCYEIRATKKLHILSWFSILEAGNWGLERESEWEGCVKTNNLSSLPPRKEKWTLKQSSACRCKSLVSEPQIIFAKLNKNLPVEWQGQLLSKNWALDPLLAWCCYHITPNPRGKSFWYLGFMNQRRFL